VAPKNVSAKVGKNFTSSSDVITATYSNNSVKKESFQVFNPVEIVLRWFSMKLRLRIALFSALLGLAGTGCSKKELTPGLLPTTVMGTVRGKQFVRAITHFHSPYSFDACDSKGLEGDLNPNPTCLADIKYALCENHINLTFLTDHVEHMADTDFSKLLLLGAGDTAVIKGGRAIATSIGCGDGFSAVMMPGLEGRLLALGMEDHIAGTVDHRKAVYGGDQIAEKTVLEDTLLNGGANALVAIPHTESRDLAALTTFQPDVIEIYNLHANLDPKIRKAYLGLIPFEHIAKFLNYLLDPFNELNADYLFMEYLQMSQVYFTTWNKLLASGLHVTGVGGLDSHENIFSQKASDGQRLDAHRRMTRFMNNLVLTSANDVDSIKAAIKAGEVFFTIEGLGTPLGLDFYGDQSGTITEMGATMTGAGNIVFKVPRIHPDFPGMMEDEKPTISAVLYYIDATGAESIVARADGAGSQIVFAASALGHYRAEALMIPHQMRKFLFNKKYADQTYRWIISNPIRLQ
jgi:predicted enzyme related to lactoylglutathione lyase